MTREVSKAAIEYLTKREGGMRLDVHDDGFGYPTVGVGHLVMDADNLKLGDTITLERGEAFLQDDLLEARAGVEQHCPVELKQHEFDALCIFTFNIGVGAFRRSTLVKRLRHGEGKQYVVSQEMPRWNKVNGQYVAGLFNRRVDTVQMFVEGDYTVDWSGLPGQGS